MPVGPLYGVTPLMASPARYPGLPPAVANVADLEMEERGGGISEDALVLLHLARFLRGDPSRKRERE